MHGVSDHSLLDNSLGTRYTDVRFMKENPSSFLPLAPAALHILLSLAGQEMHGYAIMQEVQRQSEGKYRMGPGTLYDNLQKMIERRLVEELGRKPGDEDPRRRYYRLSPLGRGVLAAEISRLDGVVREGKMRLHATPRRV
jgi:DNA-binding PadR family transcriptional regulator